MSIPSLDGALSGHGKRGAPSAVRYMTFGFRYIAGPGGNLDAAYDLLAAQVVPGAPVRLVYQMDSDPTGANLWYTIGYDASIKQTLVADNKAMTAYCDFSVTWRIRPDWRPRFSEASERFHHGSTFVHGSTFGSVGTTVIAADPQPFTVDARGTAGLDLPTLPDTGPTVTLTGPCGGAGGVLVINYSVQVADTAGTLEPLNFTVPFPLPTSGDSATLTFASQTFLATIGGVTAPFRPVKPAYQGHYWEIKNGVVNSCQVAGSGSGVVTGGSVKVDWWKKRA